eukprot:TRINITY_DN701_c0_g3_i1.p1 TRINITY_DN701_c0_g3~~TRINITY_DN701_c0_g3_i1.p1  ORF type:complete len:106 (+),score=21.74 TRINITY_DN701_c0_g3_i1:420-737(+)
MFKSEIGTPTLLCRAHTSSSALSRVITSAFLNVHVVVSSWTNHQSIKQTFIHSFEQTNRERIQIIESIRIKSVTSVIVDVVHQHHSIIHMQGSNTCDRRRRASSS